MKSRSYKLFGVQQTVIINALKATNAKVAEKSEILSVKPLKSHATPSSLISNQPLKYLFQNSSKKKKVTAEQLKIYRMCWFTVTSLLRTVHRAKVSSRRRRFSPVIKVRYQDLICVHHHLNSALQRQTAASHMKKNFKAALQDVKPELNDLLACDN